MLAVQAQLVKARTHMAVLLSHGPDVTKKLTGVLCTTQIIDDHLHLISVHDTVTYKLHDNTKKHKQHVNKKAVFFSFPSWFIRYFFQYHVSNFGVLKCIETQCFYTVIPCAALQETETFVLQSSIAAFVAMLYGFICMCAAH